MSFDQWKYFERYAYGPPLFPEFKLKDNIEIIVVIPCYRETSIVAAVQSLAQCEVPDFQVIVMVVINAPENADEKTSAINASAADQLMQLELPDFITLKVHQTQLPHKKAGVGLARKIGMDEAARLFNALGKDGLITCFDADCTCDPSYFKVIRETFIRQQLEAGIIHYEHPLTNPEIVQYELFLRYHVDALRFAQFPHAYQTLGSCITVRSSTYQKHGGMNTRKAGEDFYFLHKIIPHCRFGEINDSTILPASRESARVPFGTGIALTKIAQQADYLVYAPESFVALRALCASVEEFYLNKDTVLPDSMKAFLESNDFADALKGMRNNVSSFNAFQKRFFTWWDAFRALKYVHFARDHYFPLVDLVEALQWLDQVYWKLQLSGTQRDQLLKVRQWDRAYKPE